MTSTIYEIEDGGLDFVHGKVRNGRHRVNVTQRFCVDNAKCLSHAGCLTEVDRSEKNFETDLSPRENEGESVGKSLVRKLNGKVKKGSRASSDFNVPTLCLLSCQDQKTFI